MRAQLGVGWNRALPAPFEFSNAWKPDAVNDYFKLVSGPLVAPYVIPGDFITFELWIRITAAGGGYRVIWDWNNGFGFGWNFDVNSGNRILNSYTSNSYLFNDPALQANNNLPIHLVFYYNKSNPSVSLYVNNNAVYASSFPSMPGSISSFHIGSKTDGGAIADGNFKIDEFRIYKGQISESERRLNYNAGIGNNPSITENLLAWWDFHEAQSDTMLWPGGLPVGWSAGTWGVPDKTNNGNHLMQVGMINNATLGGALQAW